MRRIVETLAWQILILSGYAFAAGAEEVADIAVFADGKDVVVAADGKMYSTPATNRLQPNGPPADRTAAILYLNDGDYFTGSLQNSPAKNIIRWDAQGAVEPFEFAANTVRSAYF